ncbi:MMS19 nucleotide excision repair protein, putative isoform 3 [Hibiscus syriacus]|uniref:MMS19 nucleotide excision repair protein n=1 Tax=Hibiscus syriacus TaxID=106335 RepID=A0A6A2WBS9_HIBSY|nr:MMS19 nucleotide excision repair protein, putative isoform 3 [Hibiscus syriacus]
MLDTLCKGFEELLLQFAINIWNQIESTMVFNASETNERGVIDAMKLAVASYSEEKQSIIVQKSYNILLSTFSFPSEELLQQERLQFAEEEDNSSGRDEWVLSLFAAVIIAVHPQTRITNTRVIVSLFMTTLLNGNVVAAQALGSMVNKLDLESIGGRTSSDCTLEEAIDILLQSSLWIFQKNSSSNTQAKIIGVHDTGLIMQGHEKVKDMTMIFLQCLQSSGKADISNQEKDVSENNYELDLHHSVMKSVADAFQILMGDSERCLNQEFHAVIRPLYKQRFFSTIMPLLQSLVMKLEPLSRLFVLRDSAHIIIDTPLVVVLSDTKKIIPMLLDGLSALSDDVVDKDVIYGLLLVLSGILMHKNGQEAVSDSAHTVVNCLIDLIQYPHTMVIRAVIKALNDPKRAVRQEAVRCRLAWASIA